MILQESHTYGRFTIIIRFSFSTKNRNKTKFNDRYELFYKNIILKYYVSETKTIKIYEGLCSYYTEDQEILDEMFKYVLSSFNKPTHKEYKDGGIQWRTSKTRFKKKHKVLDYIYEELVKSEKDMLIKLNMFNE
jgi:hypothetical protein